jgi:alpha-1,2-mannosyltransferase
MSMCTGGGLQALRDAGLYATHEPRSFTYPPFAAVVFAFSGGTAEIALKISMIVLSLAVLVWVSVRAAGFGWRPELAFAAVALSLLTQPVVYTLHLGEINLILAGLIAADLLRRHDGAWWQGVATGAAAGIKLTPLIFVAYLLATRRIRAAAAAMVTFGGTVIVGFVLLPAQSRSFWLRGVFLDQRRIGNNYNPANQSLAGMMARLGGGLPAVHTWWVLAALVTGAAGLAIAATLHPPGPAAGWAGLLRAHRRPRLPDLVDTPLGVGDPAAGGHGRDCLAPPLTSLGRGHRGLVHSVFRPGPHALARP